MRSISRSSAGEVDGNGITYANLVSRKPQWIEKNLMRPMIQFGSEKRFKELAERADRTRDRPQ